MWHGFQSCMWVARVACGLLHHPRKLWTKTCVGEKCCAASPPGLTRAPLDFLVPPD
jgi:hypothetical protein